MSNKSKKKISYYLEIWYPYIISILPLCILKLYLSGYNIKNLKDIFSIFITVDTLMIGFIGTVVSILMSLKFDNKLIKEILKDDRFKIYTRQSLAVGFFSIIAIIFKLFLPVSSLYITFNKIMFYVCLYLMTATFLTFYRFYKICFLLIFWDDEIKEEQMNKPSPNEECRSLYRTEGKS